MDSNTGRPRIFETPEQLQGAIDRYFSYCETMQKPMTITGLANALGMDRRTIINYKERKEFAPIIKEARSRIEQYAEESLFNSKNVAGVIFNLKNNYGWTDDRNINQNISTTFSLSQLHEQARRKMVENIPPESLDGGNSTQNDPGIDLLPDRINVPIEDKIET